jgi:Protein of unknown function (DUF2752)
MNTHHGVNPMETARRPELRLAAGGMIAIAAAWPLLPHPPSLCPLRSVTGIPCPLCGMTRAVVAAVQGDIVASVRYHPAGLLVLALALVLVIRPSLVTAVWRAVPRRIPAWLLVVPVVALWAYNIGWNPTFS